MTPEPRQLVLDLGCGMRKKPGSIGVDIARLDQVDVLADVFRPLPFRDSSVDGVYASHLVEHLEDLQAFMNEVWRICKPGALVHFRFPHGSTPYLTWVDPTHRRGVFLGTFEYFDPDTFAGRAFGYYQP
ncbi:MAG: class I SAM-dependent methyltransferase, partial [Dehalococcoidia bacterium]